MSSSLGRTVFSESILPYPHVRPYFHLLAWERGIIENPKKVLQKGTKWGKEAHSKVLSFSYLSIVRLRNNPFGYLWDRVWGTLGHVSRRKQAPPSLNTASKGSRIEPTALSRSGGSVTRWNLDLGECRTCLNSPAAFSRSRWGIVTSRATS